MFDVHYFLFCSALNLTSGYDNHKWCWSGYLNFLCHEWHHPWCYQTTKNCGLSL